MKAGGQTIAKPLAIAVAAFFYSSAESWTQSILTSSIVVADAGLSQRADGSLNQFDRCDGAWMLAAAVNRAAHHSLGIGQKSGSLRHRRQQPWADANLALMQRAERRGELRVGADLQTASQVVPSMAAYRSLILRQPFELQFLTAVVDGVLLPALLKPESMSLTRSC